MGLGGFPLRGGSGDAPAVGGGHAACTAIGARVSEGRFHDCFRACGRYRPDRSRDAIAHGGRTIAVLGTPISRSYSAEIRELQRRILLHVQFPQAKIIGLFIARRVPETVDPDEFDVV